MWLVVIIWDRVALESRDKRLRQVMGLNLWVCQGKSRRQARICDEHKNPLLACCFALSTLTPKAATPLLIPAVLSWTPGLRLISLLHPMRTPAPSLSFPPSWRHMIITGQVFPRTDLEWRPQGFHHGHLMVWVTVPSTLTLATYLPDQKALDSSAWVPCYYSYDNTEPGLRPRASLVISSTSFWWVI